MKVLRTLPGQITSGWASPDLHTLCLTTENQLWRLEGGTWTGLALPRDFHGTIARVFRDHAGRIFLRSRSAFWRMNAWNEPWTDLSPKLPGNATSSTPTPPVEDDLGRIWVGTSKGLACFDGDQAWTLGEAKGLPDGWAGTVFVDREGSLWAGGEGIHKLKGRFQWTHFGIHQGLPSPNVWDIRRNQDGRGFACTDHGVAVLKGETWAVLAGTEGRILNACGGKGSDTLWFAGSGKDEASNVVFHFDLKANRLEKVPVKPVKTTDLILALSGDGVGGAYLGTLASGVYHLIRDKGQWRTEALPFPGHGASERVNCLRKDGQGRLWAAGEHGLSVLAKGQWTRLGVVDGLLGDNCASLARDAKGFICVSY